MTKVNETPLLHSLMIQVRVIGALLMREIITRYGRHNLGFLWLFLEPMLFTLGVTALWTATKSVHASTLPIVPFAVTGYASVLLWRNSSGRCAKAIEPNLSLLYHRNVRVLDIFFARLILEIAGSSITLIVISLAFIAADWMQWPANLLEMIQAWFLLTWFSIALGLIVGAISERSEVFERFWHTITYLLFPLSGCAFMVDWLPQRAQQLVLLNPIVHATEMLRHGYFGETVRTYENLSYLIVWNLGLLLLGLALIKETGRRVEPE